MDADAVCQGLANAAQTVAGLTAYPVLPSTLAVVPAFAPIDWSTEYDRTFNGGMTENLFTAQVFTSRTGDSVNGRNLLVAYTSTSGAYSIKAALEADRTLGGVAKTLIVERVRGVARIYEVAGVDFLGAQFEVRVWA